MFESAVNKLQASIDNLYNRVDFLQRAIKDNENEVNNKRDYIKYEQEQLKKLEEKCERQNGQHEAAIKAVYTLIKEYESAINKLKN